MKITVLCTALAMISLFEQAWAGYEHTCSPWEYNSGSRASFARVCGPRLTRRIQGICGEKGIYTGRRKREISSPISSDSMFLEKDKASTFLSTYKRSGGRTGIVCECCINSCSQNEMMQYCDSGKKRRRRNAGRAIDPISEGTVEEFYSAVQRLLEENGDETHIDLEWLERQPFIQRLEKNKEHNIDKVGTSAGHGGSSKRADHGESDHDALRKYLAEKLKQYLSGNDENSSQSKATTAKDPQAKAWRRLIELLEY